MGIVERWYGLIFSQNPKYLMCCFTVVAAPIIGATKLENLRDAIGKFPVRKSFLKIDLAYWIAEGIFVKLTDEEIKYLEEPYRPMKIIGHQ